jgi:raffinose/stachyose/melibiose transport system substrate-binding protein
MANPPAPPAPLAPPVKRDPSRRRFLGGSGLAMVGLALPSALAACSSEGGSNTLSIWIDITGSKQQAFFENHVVKPFEKQTGLTVEATYYQGQDLRRLLQSALQAKSGPDIVRGAGPTQTIAWRRANLLTELTPYANKYGWRKDLMGWSTNEFMGNGELWAMPLRLDTMLLYYNKTLFANHGWSTPTSRDELESLAAEAKGKGIVPFGATNVDWTAGPEWLMTVFWNNYSGPDALYQALTGKIQWTEPVFVDAVELLNSYFKKGWFGGGVDKYFSVPSAQMGAMFGEGKAAMFPQGEWWMSSVGTFFGKAAGNSNEWDWAPFPSLKQGLANPVYSIGVGGSLGINAASTKKDDAAKFLNWYYGSPSRALEWMADVPATYNIPIPISGSSVPASMDPRSKRLLTSVNSSVSSGNYGYVTWTWWPPKSDTYVYEGLQQVLTGKITAQQFCTHLNTTFQQEAKAGLVPPIPARSSAQ